MDGGIKNAARRLKTEGVDPDIQKKLDISCPTPHIHPAWKRNDSDWKPRNI